MPDKKYRAYHTDPFNACKAYPVPMGEGQLRQIFARCIYPPPPPPHPTPAAPAALRALFSPLCADLAAVQLAGSSGVCL